MQRRPSQESFSGDIGRLYRLRSLTDDFGRKTIEDVILRQEMFWSSPTSFNDPLDCRPNLIFGRTQTDRDNWIRDAIKKQLRNRPRSERRRAEKLMKKAPPEEHSARAKKSFENFMNESAVCCFSKRADNTLMWSHYGDCHRGVNLIFEEIFEEGRNGIKFVAYDVDYRKKRPEVDITTMLDGVDGMKASILTKADDWNYEEEKRMISYREPAGLRAFPAEAFKGLIFGARTSDADKEWVHGLLAQSDNDLEVWQASLSETEFSIDLKQIL